MCKFTYARVKYKEVFYIMSEHFFKIKKHFNRDALIKSILFGLAFGALVSGLLVLILTLSGVNFPVFLYVLIGLGAALAALLAGFLAFRKNDIATARVLDREYALREKVETMVVFRDEDGEMFKLQRADAERTLSLLSIKKSLMKRFGTALAALVLASAILLTNVVIAVAGNRTDDSSDNKEESFSVTEWQRNALAALIEEAKGYAINEELRLGMVAELERLLDAIDDTSTRRKLREEVVASIVVIDLLTENVNTYKKIGTALGACENITVKLLALAILSLNGIGFSESLAPVSKKFEGAMYRSEIEAFVLGADSSLNALTLNADDPLLVKTKELVFSLDAVLKLTTTNENVIRARIERAFSNASDGMGTALSAQYENKVKSDAVIQKLIDIFEIPEQDIPPLLGDIVPTVDVSDEDDSSGSDKENTGGYGSGNNLFGSDDVIYDPIYKEGGAGYVKYGDVLADYYKQIEDLLISGKLDEETQRKIINYFARLSDGTKKD